MLANVVNLLLGKHTSHRKADFELPRDLLDSNGLYSLLCGEDVIDGYY